MGPVEGRIRRTYVVVTVVASALAPQVASAHGRDTHALWGQWNWDVPTLLSLGLLCCLYGLGVMRVKANAAMDRAISRSQPLAFAAAIVALAIALISPLDPASDELQSAHMIQHMVIMMIAAPLFVLSAPSLMMLCALPRGGRQAAGRWWVRLRASRPPRYLLWQPLLLCMLFAVTLWIWHLPTLYETALHNRVVHDFQHIAFFVASCLFWRVLLDPLSRLRMNVAAGVVYLFLTSLHATILGVFMALSPRLWYATYAPRTAAWGLTPLEDQQLAGLIMWMPACMIYAGVAAGMFALWLHRADDPRAQVVAVTPVAGDR